MEKGQKITKLRLDVSGQDEFTFLGLVSAEPDYKLSLAINRKLKLSLRHADPVIIPNDSPDELSFSRYADSSKSPEIAFSLFSNRSAGNVLIKKLKNVDFILTIHDPESSVTISEIIAGLREIKIITAVFNLDMSTIKDKNLQLLTD